MYCIVFAPALEKGTTIGAVMSLSLSVCATRSTTRRDDGVLLGGAPSRQSLSSQDVWSRCRSSLPRPLSLLLPLPASLCWGRLQCCCHRCRCCCCTVAAAVAAAVALFFRRCVPGCSILGSGPARQLQRTTEEDCKYKSTCRITLADLGACHN